MFTRRILSILTSQFVILFLSLATGVFLSRALGKDLKGQFDLVSTFSASVGLLLNLGIGSALIYYTNREIDERPWITSSAYLLQLVIVIAGFIGLLLVQPVLTRVLFQNKVPVSLIYIGIWITPILTLLGLSYNLLTGLAEFGKIS